MHSHDSGQARCPHHMAQLTACGGLQGGWQKELRSGAAVLTIQSPPALCNAADTPAAAPCA